MPESPVTARIDADRVKQCLVNLLQNAVEAVSHGGQLEVEVTEDDHETIIAIRDDGMGLPTSAPAGRLFDLFYSTKDKGSGLGLSTVKKIIDAHRGQISITPRPARPGQGVLRGAEVRLVFPKNSYF